MSNGGGTLASVNGAMAIYGGTIGGSGPLAIGDGLDQGTIILKGANFYTGGTTINAGILEVGADLSLGTAQGGLTFNGGTLETIGTFNTERTVTLKGAGGTFEPDTGTTFSITGAITGLGGFTKTGTGTVILGGNDTCTGATTVLAGTLQAGSAGGLVNDTAYTVNGGIPGSKQL